MIEIRLIAESEIKEAEMIMRESFPPSYYSIFYLHPESTLVAAEDGRILGGINLDIYEATVKAGYIGWLYVSEEARGRGIGKMLADSAISFLENDAKADEILLCIEGDNPSSFKNFAARPGFEIMSLADEIRTFRWNIFRVYRHASRFFDMGYFMWHKSKGSDEAEKSLSRSIRKQLFSFLLTLLADTLLYILMAVKMTAFSPGMLLIPSLVLSVRALCEAVPLIIMKTPVIFLPWDTSWISSVLSLVLPFYFPSPGGIYPSGNDWSLKEKQRALGISAIITAAAEAAMLIIFRGKYAFMAFALPLFLLDTVFPMYPFCGFLASRIRRITGRHYPIAAMLALLISIITIFF